MEKEEEATSAGTKLLGLEVDLNLLAIQLHHLNTDLHKSDLSLGRKSYLYQPGCIAACRAPAGRRLASGGRGTPRTGPRPRRGNGRQEPTSAALTVPLQAAALVEARSWFPTWAVSWREETNLRGFDLELELGVVAGDGDHDPDLLGHDSHPGSLSERSQEPSVR